MIFVLALELKNFPIQPSTRLYYFFKYEHFMPAQLHQMTEFSVWSLHLTNFHLKPQGDVSSWFDLYSIPSFLGCRENLNQSQHCIFLWLVIIDSKVPHPLVERVQPMVLLEFHLDSVSFCHLCLTCRAPLQSLY